MRHRTDFLYLNKFVPLNLAMQVKSNGSLLISSDTKFQLCPSKFYDIWNDICTHIKFGDFTPRIKPWNFQQYVYLLPSGKSLRANTLWLHNTQNGVNKVLTNVIGLISSAEDSNNVQWPVERLHVDRLNVQLGQRENIILFFLSLPFLHNPNQTLRIIPPSARSNPWSDIYVPGYVRLLSLNVF